MINSLVKYEKNSFSFYHDMHTHNGKFTVNAKSKNLKTEKVNEELFNQR